MIILVEKVQQDRHGHATEALLSGDPEKLEDERNEYRKRAVRFIDGTVEQDEPCGERVAKRRKLQRVKSYKWLVDSDNALRQVGLSLRHFAQPPEADQRCQESK